MRNLIFVIGAVVITAHAYAQQQSSPPPAATTSDAPPPLVKTVVVEPTDSPMVRAAKRAVAARVHPSQRRVLSLNATMTQGRIAQGSGTTELPQVPPPSIVTTTLEQREAARRAAAQKAAAEKTAAVQKRLKELEEEEGRLAQEADQQYGDDVDEDLVEKRLAEIAAERKKLLATPPPK